MKITILGMLYLNWIPVSYHKLLSHGNGMGSGVLTEKNVKPHLIGKLKLEDVETSRYFEIAINRQLRTNCVFSFHPSLTLTVSFKNVITSLITRTQSYPEPSIPGDELYLHHPFLGSA